MTDPRDGAGMEALKAIYDSLPRIRCWRRCWDSCGPIGMTSIERQYLKSETGQEIPPGIIFRENLVTSCPQLSRTNRCKVYAARPLICRIWGLTELLKCPYGCRPEGGFLPEEEAYVLLNDVRRLSGDLTYTTDDIRRRVRDGSFAKAGGAAAALAARGVNPLNIDAGVQK